MKIINYKALAILASILPLVFAVTQTNIFGSFIKTNSTAYAVGDLVIDWGVPDGQPIFVVENLLPGDTQEREVKVENGAGSSRPIGIRGLKTSETGDLSQILTMTISENGNPLYGPKKLSEFFTESENPDGIFLQNLNANNTATYLFQINFDQDADNGYQETSVIFDIEIGISVKVPEECRQIQFAKIIYGTQGNDYLRGTNGNELIIGFEGNDNIDGSNGNDCLIGNEGNDRIGGSNGNDVIFGNEGNDTIDGSNGNDQIFAGSGNDKVDGSNGNDLIYGHQGNDKINAGNDQDKVWGGEGSDNIDGSNGNDSLYGEEGNDILKGGNGEDNLEGNTGNDSLFGDNGNDRLLGGPGLDSANGNLGKDTCEAESKSNCEF